MSIVDLRRYLLFSTLFVAFALILPQAHAADRSARSLLVLYDFQEASGDLIRDRSGVGKPLDLKIEKAASVQRQPGRLTIKSSTKIVSAEPPAKILDAVKRSQEITIEAWIKPVSDRQSGPARIVSLSRDPNQRNFTLGQDGNRFDVRLRTSSTNANGTPSTATGNKSLGARRTHVVYTRDRSGNAKVYLDGKQQAKRRVTGNFSKWDSGSRLVLANELTGNRPWLGDYHLVAIYGRALAAQEVVQNFRAGTRPEEARLAKSDAKPPGNSPAAEATAKDFDEIVSFLETYCVDCHTGPDGEEGVDLSQLQESSQVNQHRKLWERTLRILNIAGMPPEDHDPQPGEDERTKVLTWLDKRLHEVDCDLVDDVGRVTIRRLNRTEYNNTIRDLVGVDIDPAEDFPSDDVGYGFDNMGDVLSISPLLLEKYVSAAKRIAETAIVDGKPSGKLPASHTNIIFVRPSDKKSPRQASKEVLGRFMRRAYRRPVDSAEVDRLVQLVELAMKQGESFEGAIRLGVQAALVSPHFLFRVEIDPKPDDSKTQHAVREHELASRLSYFLWSTMPDEELMQLADRKQLHDRQVLRQQVKRMLSDPRSDQLVKNFAGQWLNLRNLEEITPDPKKFSTFTPELRSDMVRETELFVTSILRDDRSILDFIDADFSFVNERLARHYGIPDVKGNKFQRVSLPSSQRSGVLTHASILTLTSNPTRTSLVKRGKWILDNVLAVDLPDPPADVPPLEEAAKSAPNASLREQLKLHRSIPGCASCHKALDPLGFGLENFDAIGRWREKEGQNPVDSSGTLPSGESFSGPVELARILRKREEQFAGCLSEKMLTYALGRGLEYYDQCEVDRIVESLGKNDYRFSVLVNEIVLGKPFLMRRGENEKE